MSMRLNCFVAVTSVVTLCLVAACGSDSGAGAPSGGAASGGKSGAAGSPGAAGLSSAGQSAGGSAGLGGGGVAGLGGGAGSSGANSVGGGSAGANTTGSAGSSSGIEPSFATVKLVFGGGGGIESCAAAPCHGVGGNAPPGNPVTLADNEQLYMNLTTYVSKACGNLKLVSPGKPAESALLKILTGPCGVTPQMPYQCKPADGSCIPADYVAAISQWISNGAPKQ